MEEVGLSALPSAAFWRGKRVVLTGHTGFKGAWLALWLRRMGATVIGVSLAPSTTPSLFTLAGVGELVESHLVDIRDASRTAETVRDARPDVVLHLAAQALVRASYRDPRTTFSTNVQGTANVLEAVREASSVRVVVAVTTDKVYRNLESGFPFRETDPLGGHDPYSASKAAAEMVIESYRQAFLAPRGVAVAAARAGNVIGGGDWSEDRIIPDAVRAWQAGRVLVVRRPGAVRPWQHVLEPIAAYLRLAERLWEEPSLAGAYNFGPHTHEAATVKQLVEIAAAVYGGGETSWGDGTDGPHEAGWLSLEIARARTLLGIVPRWALGETVGRTLGWYRRHRDGASARELCEEDIAAFEALGAGGAT